MHGCVRAAACGAAWLLPLLAPEASAQSALTTAFTYQGRLADGGSPADGVFDFRFLLFDDAVAGNQVGPVDIHGDVPVAAGLFTVTLQFGAVFAHERRFLEVAVRPGASTGAYTTVTRHELTAAPSALFGATAPWPGVTGKPAGFADNVDNDTTYSAGAGIQVSGAVISIPPFAVTNAMLAADSVTQASLADNAVGSAEMADNSIGSAEIANGSVAAADLATGAVQAVHIGADQVTEPAIANNAVTRAQLSGNELAVYTPAAGCADHQKITLAQVCQTIACDVNVYYNCTGGCSSGVPLQCNATLRGYLLGPTIP